MLISIKNVSKAFKTDESWFFPRYQQVVKAVSLTINEGECVGIIGESGSGKSTLGRLILGLEKPDEGKITLGDTMRARLPHQAMSVVFQDYTTSVNPRLTIKDIISEPLMQEAMTDTKRNQLLENLLHEVGLPTDVLMRYPHQLSGGQLQRVCIARAIAPNPMFILLDEAVSSLDVSVQVQILTLLQTLKAERNISYLFITHDITVTSFLCDRLMFFKKGEIVERVEDMQALTEVAHPYAKTLLEAASQLEIPFNIEPKQA